MADKEVKVKITGDSKDFNNSVDTSKNKLSEIGKLSPGLEKITQSFSSMRLAILGVATGVGAALAGTIAFMKSNLALYNKQMKVETQLAAVLKSTSHAAGMSAKELKDLASGLQDVTTFGDETIIGAENMLLTFTKIGKDVFPEALETVLDMSTAMGTDLKGSAIQLGKALNDPITGISALKEVGVNFTQQQVDQVKALVASGKALEAQKLIIKELQTEFGGSARAQAATLEGTFSQLSNKFGDLREEMVKSWGTGLLQMADDLNKFVSWAESRLKKQNENYGKEVRYYIEYTEKQLAASQSKQQEEVLKKRLDLYKRQLQMIEGASANDKFTLENQKVAAAQQASDKIYGIEYAAHIRLLELQGKKQEVQNLNYQKEIENARAVGASVLEIQAYYAAQSLEYQRTAGNEKLIADTNRINAELQTEQQAALAKIGFKSKEYQAAEMFANAGAQLMSSQNKQLFKIGQLASVATAWMNIAQAITKGYTYGPVIGTAYAALMGVVGGVQTKNIMSQKPPGSVKTEKSNLTSPTLSAPVITPPKFETGVFNIPRDTFAQLHAGETVIPKNFTESIKDGELSLGGGGVTVNIYGDSYGYDDLMGKITSGLKDIEKRSGKQVFSSKIVD